MKMSLTHVKLHHITHNYVRVHGIDPRSQKEVVLDLSKAELGDLFYELVRHYEKCEKEEKMARETETPDDHDRSENSPIRILMEKAMTPKALSKVL